MKLSKGIQFFAGSTQTTYDLTNLNLSAGNYAITVVAEAEGFTDSDASNSVNYTVQAQLAAPTIAINADGKTLEITDVANATSYDVYVDGTLKTNVAYVKPVYTVTFSSDFNIDVDTDADLYGIYYYNKNGERVLYSITEQNYTTCRGKTFEASIIDSISGDLYFGSVIINGINYLYGGSSDNTLPLQLNGPATISYVHAGK